MIRRYVYGNVIETEAVLNKPEQENGALPYFTVDEQVMTLSYTVDEVDFDHPECIGFVENVAEYEYYNDNGYEKDYENPAAHHRSSYGSRKIKQTLL